MSQRRTDLTRTEAQVKSQVSSGIALPGFRVRLATQQRNDGTKSPNSSCTEEHFYDNHKLRARPEMGPTFDGLGGAMAGHHQRSHRRDQPDTPLRSQTKTVANQGGAIGCTREDLAISWSTQFTHHLVTAGDVPEVTSRPVLISIIGQETIAARSAKRNDAKRIRLSATSAEAGAFRAVAPWEALSSQAPTRMRGEPHGASPGQAS